jgi:predicted RNase H-like nuclease (RuvC/YqgF family)
MSMDEHTLFRIEIRAALEERITDVLREINELAGRLKEKIAVLESRINSLEADSENDFSAHERALEHRDRDIARLQEQLRDKDSDLYRLEQEISRVKSDLQRSQRGW